MQRDTDPEARLSAANIQLQMEDFLTASEGGREAGTAGGMARGDSETGADIRQPSDDRKVVSNPRQLPYLSSPPTNGDPLFNTSDWLFEIYRHPDARPPPYSPSRYPCLSRELKQTVFPGVDASYRRWWWWRLRCWKKKPHLSASSQTGPESEELCSARKAGGHRAERLGCSKESAAWFHVRNSLILETGDDDTGTFTSALCHLPPPSTCAAPLGASASVSIDRYFKKTDHSQKMHYISVWHVAVTHDVIILVKI